VRRLDESGVVPSDLSLRRPSLDDVFLALTGRGTTPEDAEDAEANGARQGRRRAKKGAV